MGMCPDLLITIYFHLWSWQSFGGDLPLLRRAISDNAIARGLNARCYFNSLVTLCRIYLTLRLYGQRFGRGTFLRLEQKEETGFVYKFSSYVKVVSRSLAVMQQLFPTTGTMHPRLGQS